MIDKIEESSQTRVRGSRSNAMLELEIQKLQLEIEKLTHMIEKMQWEHEKELDILQKELSKKPTSKSKGIVIS